MHAMWYGVYIRRGLRVASSSIKGNARASKDGTGKSKFHAFFVSMNEHHTQKYENTIKIQVLEIPIGS